MEKVRKSHFISEAMETATVRFFVTAGRFRITQAIEESTSCFQKFQTKLK